MDVLLVPPRYGSEIVGGAETLMRGLAHHMPNGTRVEVATTCAVDHETWENVLPEGTELDGVVPVHRFATDPRDTRRHHTLAGRLVGGARLSYGEELEFMETSVTSRGLMRFLEREGERFDLIVFGPYLFGTTFWGAQVHPERSVILPCLHDEPYAHMRCMRNLFGGVRGCLFNTAAERRLADRLFPIRRSAVVGLGFDPPTFAATPGFAKRHGLGRYVVYAGRLEEAKGVHRAVDHVTRVAQSGHGDLRLVLIGRGPYRVPHHAERWVLNLGYVDEDQKRSALAEAVALVNPSELESLSIVVMESWLEGTPVLVAAGSEVLAEHVAHSSGGLTYDDSRSFAATLGRLLADPDAAHQMGAAGRAYVHAEYSWDRVGERLESALERLAKEPVEAIS